MSDFLEGQEIREMPIPSKLKTLKMFEKELSEVIMNETIILNGKYISATQTLLSEAEAEYLNWVLGEVQNVDSNT